MSFRKKEAVAGYLFAGPSILGFLLFFGVPFLMSVIYSLTKGVGNIQFVGFQNFVDLFFNSAFRLAVKNTLLFNLLSVPLLIMISLVITLLLQKNNRINSLFRTVFTMPLILPVASIVVVWQIFFAQKGIVNGILLHFGLQGPDYLKSGWSFFILMLLYIWKNCGYDMILFLAGLNNIPKEYYEAAAIDGCSRTESFLRITMPLLTPTFFFTFILSLINSFKIYREAYLLAGQYPDSSIYMLQHFMNNNFMNLNYQSLSSASILIFLFIGGLIYILYKFQSKYSVE